MRDDIAVRTALHGDFMKQAMNWFEHLHNLAEQGRDLNVYGERWAHDVRCLRTGTAHRRVGATGAGHDEWLQAGYVSRSVSAIG